MLYVHYGFIVCFKGYIIYENANSCFSALNLGVYTDIINIKHVIKLWVSHPASRTLELDEIRENLPNYLPNPFMNDVSVWSNNSKGAI